VANDDSGSDGLDEQWRDKLVAIGKGVAGAIPVVGGLVGELVGVAIPGQRADRIAYYLRGLAVRIDDLSKELRGRLASSVEKIDLIEEGGFQAARATSRERIDRILAVVMGGLSEEDAEVVRRKRLLAIFGELDDDEVNFLNAYGRSYAGADRSAFEKIDIPGHLTFGSPQSAFDKNYLYEAGINHLSRLGLLKKDYGNVRNGELPVFDKIEGDFKHRLEISGLGRILLREIGLETPFDARQRDA
jgi:hypothetical protein